MNESGIESIAGEGGLEEVWLESDVAIVERESKEVEKKMDDCVDG